MLLSFLDGLLFRCRDKGLLISIICLSLFHSVDAQQKQIAAGLEGISDAKEIAAQADEWITTIDSTINEVQDNEFYKTLVDGYSAGFPLGILPGDGDQNYALYVDNMKMDAVSGTTVQVFMKIPFNSGESLYFMADQVPLSKSGQLTGDFKLLLVESKSIEVGDGYSISINGLNAPGAFDSTFVTFNCNGFKEVTLSGSLDFDEGTVEEFSEEGNGDPLSLDFLISADKLTNLLIQFDNIPSLQFNSLPGFRCTVNSLTWDRHEQRNGMSFTLPEWYADSLQVINPDADFSNYDGVTWEGVYIPEVVIEIPRKFTEGSEDNEIVTVTSEHIIVDQYGITALTNASKVLKGNLKGFEYGVDSLRLNVIGNNLSQAGFYGQMRFPICEEESTVGFGLTISRGVGDGQLAYQGYADLETNLYAEAFGLAQIGLTGCRLDFEHRNDQFFPKATLDGWLAIAPSSEGASEPVGNIGLEFGQLTIFSSSPYVGIGEEDGYIRLKEDEDSKMGNLPVTISKPGIRRAEGGQKLGLEMTLSIHLQKSEGKEEASGNGFSGTADFTVWTKRHAATKTLGYDGFQLNTVTVEVQNGGFNLDGRLEMFDEDPVYGKGFCGYAKVEIVELLTVESSLIFGKKKELTDTIGVAEVDAAYKQGDSVDYAGNQVEGSSAFRYFFADGVVKFTPALPIATGIEINSFTGGLYYNMGMKGPGEEDIPTGVNCKTASGRTYTPDNKYFGVLAGIGLQSTGGGTAFNGEINFGVEFSKGGGINKIATWGGVKFVTMDFQAPDMGTVASGMSGEGVSDNTEDEVKSEVPEGSEAVKANWFVQYDFTNKTLTGNFDIYVDVVDVVKGSGGANKAGNISIYAGPELWYVYVGQPVDNKMIGLDVLGIFKIQSYMCIGSMLPTPAIASMPPEIKPDINIDYSLLGMGGGLSFGSRLTIDEKPGLPLFLCKARIELPVYVASGFDILLSKANEPVICGGEERGINDWYATGQAYLYGEVGLNLSYDCLAFGSNTKEVLSFFLSAFVFAQLPNPTYMKGEIKVGFKALAKNWSKSLSFRAGDECVSNTLDNKVEFIEGITPAGGSKDVPTGESINIFFSNPVLDFPYKIQGGENSTGTYRAYIDEGLIEVYTPDGPVKVVGELNDEKTRMILTPENAYPGNTEITVIVKVITQVKEGDTWRNTNSVEADTVTFTTVEDPGYIPVTDIHYAYPLPDMENFYINESSRGYVRLAVLPRRAVELAEGYEFNIAVYEYQNEIDRSNEVAYNGRYGENNFTFDIPTVRMDPGKEYTIKIIKAPIPEYYSETYTREGSEIAGTVDPGRQDTVILEYSFKTSKYTSFSEKISLYGTAFSEVFDGVMAANLSLNDQRSSGSSAYEPLSDEETDGFITEGTRKTLPLVRFGDISYDNQSISTIQEDIESIGSVDLQNNPDRKGYTTVNNMISELNQSLRDMNMECLVTGGCSSSQLETVRIPKGEFVLPVGYYLPGQSEPTSKYSLIVDLEDDIILPR